VHTLEVAHDNEYALFVAVAIKAAMYYRGLSTEELARLLGLHVETIRRWLRAMIAAYDALREDGSRP
jgi:transposase